MLSRICSWTTRFGSVSGAILLGLSGLSLASSEPLLVDGRQYYHLEYSPDGTEIACAFFDGETTELWLVDLAGLEATQIDREIATSGFWI